MKGKKPLIFFITFHIKSIVIQKKKFNCLTLWIGMISKLKKMGKKGREREKKLNFDRDRFLKRIWPTLT